jgi:hypothetical protein
MPELKKIKEQSQPCLGSDEPQRLLTEFDISIKTGKKVTEKVKTS